MSLLIFQDTVQIDPKALPAANRATAKSSVASSTLPNFTNNINANNLLAPAALAAYSSPRRSPIVVKRDR